ncbi:hypothetical protein PVAND_012694 [Polypedilum vanderplanki]|uniref:Adenylate cyclase n=1 Tax=Polypedilum vanderplanki TaxID=319348 RepID=A0A9J6CP47_POLVA|nr:hypothetical protein PVAND_012694 [Polypedilum vanderplanki]
MSSSQNSNQFKLYLLESSLFLFNFATVLSSSLLLNQLLKQFCIQFGYEKSLCDVISENNNSTADIEEELQSHVTNIILLKNILNSSVPAILQLFLGPWSDKNGRKKVMNFSSIGFVLTHTSIAAVCYYSDYINPLNPWIYIICYIPVNFLGGFASMSTAIICYITDNCEESKRSFHFIIIKYMNNFSFVFGVLSCSFILNFSNPTVLYTIAAICTILGKFIITISVDESVQIIENSRTTLMSILSFGHIIEMIKTCFMPRIFYGRSILLCLILTMALNKFTSACWENVGYLFARETLNWTLEEQNYLDASTFAIASFGTFFSIYVFQTNLGFSDIILISFAIFGSFIDFILRAFANQSWQMYAISFISCMKMIVNPLCRSLISLVISKNEMGKVMSFTSSVDSLAVVIASPIFISIYQATYTTFAGAFFLVCAAICFVNLFIVFYVMIAKQITSNIKNKYIEIE